MKNRAEVVAALTLLLFAACASSSRSGEDFASEVRVVPIAQAVPSGWPAGELEAFAERRRSLFESLDSGTAEERARYRDLLELRATSLDRALAAETEARLQAFVREQEDEGWRLVSRDEAGLRFERR